MYMWIDLQADSERVAHLWFESLLWDVSPGFLRLVVLLYLVLSPEPDGFCFSQGSPICECASLSQDEF